MDSERATKMGDEPLSLDKKKRECAGQLSRASGLAH